MKHRLFYLEALLLSLAAAWGAVGSLVTAFEIPLGRPWIGWWLLGWTLICMFQLSRKRGVLPLLILGIGVLWWLCRKTPLWAETLSLLGHIVKYYDQGYGIGIPQMLQTTEEFHDLPLAVYAMAVIAAICRTVCRRKGSFCAVGLLLIPLMACLVVTDTVPKTGCLFALLLSLVLLLLTDSVRGESGGQGTRLSITALVPAVLMLALLFYFVPREQAVNPTAELRGKIITYLEALPEKLREMAVSLSDYSQTREEVDLASLGSQPQLGLPIAEVTADAEGTLYLRVQDYDHYTGTAWESTAGRAESLSGTGEELGRVTVQTTLPMGALLLPAFPAGETLLENGKVQNEEELRTYTYTWMQNALGAFPTEDWLTLPADTAAWAQEVLKTVPGDLGTIEGAAAAIGSYVSASAEYSRRADPMGSGDFAQWFLSSAQSGYCVHFATTAAVLLRAAGIPARYVTGYKAELTPGQAVKITSDEAHAWVEYYNYRTWTWSILEATPSALTPPPAETEAVTIPQAQTEPEPQTEPIRESVPIPAEPEAVPPQKAEIPWKWIIGILVGLLVLGIIQVQRWMRRFHRLRRRTRGTTNRRALAWWREVQRLGNLTKKQPPEELSALAEKAMFSQHRLTVEELETFAAWAAEAEKLLMQQPLWKRAVYRYWHAVL